VAALFGIVEMSVIVFALTFFVGAAINSILP
jgi:hypothetical protein